MKRHSGQFRSRTDAMNRRTSIWHCANCRQRYYAKVKTCDYCGAQDFHYFASKLEAKRFAELCLMLDYGQISDLRVQVNYPIIINGKPICTWRADFVFVEKSGKEVIEDVKADSEYALTDVFKLKRKLVEAVYGIEITVMGMK